MRKEILALFFCTICIVADAQFDPKTIKRDSVIGAFDENNEKIGEWKYFYPDGQIHKVGNYFKGLKTGEWREYYQSSELWKIQYYENGKYTGVTKTFYRNGQLWYKSEIYEGEPEVHEVREYYENGKLKEIGKEGFTTCSFGRWKEFHPNGKLKSSGRYKGCREKVGKWKYYDEKGKLIASENFDMIN
jgi:uncharacterized protein